MHLRIAVACCLLATAARAQQPGTTLLITGDPPAFLDDVNATGPQITEDGKFVFFWASNEIYQRDVALGTVTPVCAGLEYDVTPDGRFVAVAEGPALVPEDDNGMSDVYVLDRQTGVAKLASVAMDGTAGDFASFNPSVSDDGRFVAFESDANDLVPGDTNGGFLVIGRDIFVRDLVAGTTQRVSLGWNGSESQGTCQMAAISGDGHVVAFGSTGNNLVPVDTNTNPDFFDIFVRDLTTGALSLETIDSQGLQPMGNASWPSLSYDGRFLAFDSGAKLAPGDMNGQSYAKGQDVFVRDRLSGVTTRISSNADGVSLTGNSLTPHLSEDGRWVSFESYATDLVPGDTNGLRDAFLFDRLTGQMQRTSVSSSGVQNNGNALQDNTISATGRFTAFQSNGTGLAPGDDDGFTDVYLHDRGPWVNLGGAKTGASGTPLLTGSGSLVAGQLGSLTLSHVAPGAGGILLVSLDSAPAPFKGGVLQAWPAVMQLPVMADGAGAIVLPFTWPAAVPSQTRLVFQAVVLPLQAVALSNALEAVTL